MIFGSFAGSGTITNQIIMGVPADLALLSLELDAQRLADAGVLAPQSWRSLPSAGVVNRTPFIILARPGNPHAIGDSSDLARPGIGVVHPDPLTSGGANWAIVAEYGAGVRQASGQPEGGYELLLGIWRNTAPGGRAHLGSFSVPIPADAPHEDGAPAQVLFRPEQVALSSEPPPDGVPVVGQGTIVEETFAGALRRVRLRLPRLRATRQIAPPVPFGEEGLLVDAILPIGDRPSHDELWVSLQGWHLLKEAVPRLLVYDAGSGPATALAVAGGLAGCMGATVTVASVAGADDVAEALRAAVSQRLRQARLSHAELHLRYGNVAEQIVNEQAESLYELLVVNAEGHPTDARRHLSPTLMTVLEHADAPVLVVREQRTAFRRMLICTAAGEPGKSDVRAGGRLARCLGSTATLLYVTADSRQPNPLTRAHLERAAATLHGLDVDSAIHIRPAATSAAGILAEIDAGDYDLVVVGGHGPQSRSFLGRDDVTLQVLLGTDRPVLVVPAEEE